MFKIISLILVFIAIKYVITLECYVCGSKENEYACKNETDNGKLIKCPEKETFCYWKDKPLSKFLLEFRKATLI